MLQSVVVVALVRTLNNLGCRLKGCKGTLHMPVVIMDLPLADAGSTARKGFF